jgi:Flp pilus assembly protein TadG
MRNLAARLSGPGRGQSLVEFALIIPILLLLLMGVFDLGRAVAAYNSVSNAARTAARVAVVDQNPDIVTQAAIDEAFGLNLTADDVEFDANVNSDDPCLLQVCQVEVAVSYDYVAATPIIGNIVGPITVRSETRLPIEREYESP